ncbi:MAG: hypothetical protein JW990_12795, partial [Thermoleophilia bacterium]|nr:hypothetical protein [Thermoleophilia bacterium]
VTETPEASPVEAIAPPAPTPWWETPPAPAADTAVEEALVEEAPAEEAPAEESPVAELPVEEAPLAEAAVEVAETEISLTHEVFEEPLIQGGWESAAPMVEEENLESVLPVVPDEFPAMEAAEIETERPVFEKPTEWIDSAWPEPATETPGVREAVSRTESIEGLDFETPILEEPLFETVVVEEAPVEEALVEAPDIEAPIVEAPEAEAPVSEETVVEVPATPVMDDLKARIEETRRRIRQELEQPFMSGAEAPAIADDWTVAPAVPVAEPVAEAVESAGSELAELSDAALPTGDFETAEAVMEEPVDYDSMKSRIESVRSRLKAKAFDAMMSGESALLGRDSEDAGHRRNVIPDVDSEVDETIESSLREEDD